MRVAALIIFCVALTMIPAGAQTASFAEPQASQLVALPPTFLDQYDSPTRDGVDALFAPVGLYSKPLVAAAAKVQRDIVTGEGSSVRGTSQENSGNAVGQEAQ